MDTEQITVDLNRRFAEPLPEFYKRRIIVWHDEEREFTDKIADISLEKAKIAVLTGTNYFSVKKLLGVDDTESNYLLYSPISYETPEDNWLLDIELRRPHLYMDERNGLAADTRTSECHQALSEIHERQGTPQENHGANAHSHHCRRGATVHYGGFSWNKRCKACRCHQGCSLWRIKRRRK